MVVSSHLDDFYHPQLSWMHPEEEIGFPFILPDSDAHVSP